MKNKAVTRPETNENMGTKTSIGSKAAKAAGALMILSALGNNTVEAQKLVNKKSYENILENAKLSQEEIGEDMAKFLFGGEIQRRIQLEIEKQTSTHGKKYSNEKFSIFEDEEVKNRDRDTILNKKMIEDHLLNIIDSMVTKDFARYYKAFHSFQVSGENLVGKEKGSGTYIHSGWNYAEFPIDLNVNYLQNNKDIPYSKTEQEKLKKEFEEIYEKELSLAKAKAKTYRKDIKAKEDWESADLKAIEEARVKTVQIIFKKYGIIMINQAFDEYYGTSTDATNTKNKKKK